VERHTFIPVPVWDQPEDVTLLTSLKFLDLRKRAYIHKKKLEEVHATLDVEQIQREVDALHAKAHDFRMTRIHKSEEAADALKRENLRMVSKLHTVIRDAEVRHKQLSTLSRPSTTSQASLNSSVRKQRFKQISRENADLLDRLRKAGPTVATAEELSERYNVHTTLLARRTRFRRRNVARMAVPPVTYSRPEEARPHLGMPHYMRPTKPVATLPPLQEEAHKPPAPRRLGPAAHRAEGGPRVDKDTAVQATAIEDAESPREGVQKATEARGEVVEREAKNEAASTDHAQAKLGSREERKDLEKSEVPARSSHEGVVEEVGSSGQPKPDLQDYSEDLEDSDVRALSDEVQVQRTPAQLGRAKEAGTSYNAAAASLPVQQAEGKLVHEYTDDDFESADSGDEAQDDASKGSPNASMKVQSRDFQQPQAARQTVEVERYGTDDYEEDSESVPSEESISRAPSEDDVSSDWQSQK